MAERQKEIKMNDISYLHLLVYFKIQLFYSWAIVHRSLSCKNITTQEMQPLPPSPVASISAIKVLETL